MASMRSTTNGRTKTLQIWQELLRIMLYVTRSGCRDRDVMRLGCDESTRIFDFGRNRDCGAGFSWRWSYLCGIRLAHIRNCYSRGSDAAVGSHSSLGADTAGTGDTVSEKSGEHLQG